MRSMTGQVAITTIVAEIIAGRNGRKLQSEAAINIPRSIIAKVVRVKSRLVAAADRSR